VLRGKFRHEEEEETEGSRKVHNKELHNLFASLNIIRIIMSKEMTWTEHVARMDR
jgi:hypothetical protein